MDTSQVTNIEVLGPWVVLSCSSTPLDLMSAQMIRAPAEANFTAVALPMPEDAPVTAEMSVGTEVDLHMNS